MKTYSKIPRINIELPNYKFLHSPSPIDHHDNKFIGRDQIVEHLKNILTKSKSRTGSYLITGYRGMGKSSYVNRVLNKITIRDTNVFYYLIICFLIWVVLGLILKSKLFSLLIICVSLLLWRIYNNWHFLLDFCKIIKHLKKDKWGWAIKDIIKKNWRKFKTNLIDFKNRQKRIVIKLNLGHEILDEKDVTSLIAKSIEEEFKKFAYSFRRQYFFYILKFLFLFLFTKTIFIWEKPNQELLRITKFQLFFPSQIPEIQRGSLDSDQSSSKTSLYQLTTKIEISDNYYEEYIQAINKTTHTHLYGFKNHFAQKICCITSIFDVYLDQGYHTVSRYISKKLPPHINYLFWLYFFTLNFIGTYLFNLFSRLSYFRHKTRKNIVKKLKFINENIDSVIKTELCRNIDNSFGRIKFSRVAGKTNEYPLAEIRQIEKSLVDILEDIDNLFPPISKPEFIIVFDELDKIDPIINKNDQEEESTDFDISISGFSGGASNRVKKQNILRLLGNMKYFLSSAKAKFIFISGRELYDAFLADVSDREFTISSIFNDIISVDSFLSDSSDEKKGDTVSMVEHYVCQYIMPEWYIKYKMYELHKTSRYDVLTLNAYKSYLESKRQQYTKEEREKVILLLYQFIHYLTHVSNGAPKKIINLFEKHIYSDKHNNNFHIKYIGSNKRDIYLSFGYIDQCKIGFIHYLAHPMLMAIMNNVSTYGDKLLVSASFLIDHIYKFHNNGFSWRNLENTPEILDSSRTPELRNLIETIINYLSQTHICTIISGLYIFKFPKKISEEIQFISKISEEASAIFNFSLDESSAVKRYYSRLLKYYTDQYIKEKEINGNTKAEFLHTIADIHHILGDLYLLDEDYSNAIFEYQHCLESFSFNYKGNYDIHNDSHMLFIIRNMLKLGLAYEKRKTYNSAYIIYSELTSLLFDFRYVDEKQLGLIHKITYVNDWHNYKSILYQSPTGIYKKEDKFTLETQPEIFDERDKDSIKYSFEGDNLIPDLARMMTPLKNKIIFRLSMFEDMRLMYQALLAKFFVLEKQQLGGISQANLDVIEEEFLYLHLATNLKDKFLISADFFKKLGDILYYKNGLITKESSYLLNGLYFWDYDIREDIERYSENIEQREYLKYLSKIPFDKFKEFCKGNNNTTFFELFKKYFLNNIDEESKEIQEIISNNKELEHQKEEKIINTIEEFFKKGNIVLNSFTINLKYINKVFECCNRREYLLKEKNIAPCFACKYYNRSMKILEDNLLKLPENEYFTSKAFLFLTAFEKPNYYSTRANFNQNLASILGGFGDIMVSCSTDEDYIFSDFLDSYFNYIKGKDLKLGDKLISSEKLILHFNGLMENREKNWEKLNLGVINLETDYCLFKNYVCKKDSQFSNSCLKKKLRELSDIDKKIYLDHHHDDDDVKEVMLSVNNSSEYQDNLKKIYEKGLSQLEKALLYYLASAKYYKRSSNYRESSLMYKKILMLLIQYVKSKPMYKQWIALKIDDIRKEIVRRIIQNVYSSYDHIHIIELKKFKDDLAMTEFLNNGQLSLFPELEDSIYAYYELAILCDTIKIDSNEFKKIYNSFSLSSNRLNSSIYNRLISLKFKSFLNRTIFDKLFPDVLNKDPYDNNFQCFSTILKNNKKILDDLFPTIKNKENGEPIYEIRIENKKYKNFKKNLNEKLNKEKQRPKNEIIKKIQSSLEESKHKVIIYVSEILIAKNIQSIFYDEKELQTKSLVEYLVLDSIFCLQKFVEIIYPQNKTTLFSNGHVANVYKNLYEWTKLYEYILSNKSGLNNNLESELKSLVDESNLYMVDSDYLAESAIKKYQSAFSMHKEGKTYKETIEDLYYLNDDLDNESFKFYLAIERYQINTSEMYDNMRKLKDSHSWSPLFVIEDEELKGFCNSSIVKKQARKMGHFISAFKPSREFLYKSLNSSFYRYSQN